MSLKKLKRKLKKIAVLLRRAFDAKSHRRFFYAYHYKHSSILKGTILIESFHGQNISDSGLLFAKEILRLYPNQYKIYFATQNKSEHQKFIDSQKLDVELIDVFTFKYSVLLARVEYIFTNVALPPYHIKKEGQTYLQTWHGTPLKTLGKKMKKGAESLYLAQHSFLHADYLTHPNDFTRDIIMNDYNIEKVYTGKVVMAGYPRNEIFMKPERAKAIREELGLTDKTVYAYMPTWRGASTVSIHITDYARETVEILDTLDKSLSDSQILYVNFHPILRGAVKLKDYKHIKTFPQNVDSYEFLNSVDCLITDYSSVFFDFSITKKPIILFMYDYEKYIAERGIEIDMDTLPFRKVYSVEDMCETLKTDIALKDDYSDSPYCDEFLKYDAPDITEKLLKLVFENDPTDLKVDDYSYNKNKEFKLISPPVVKTASAFESLKRISADDTITVLQKKWFKPEVSDYLYPYNDAFNYIITCGSMPNTYLETALYKLGFPYTRKKVDKRTLFYRLPFLKVNTRVITDISCYEEGCEIDPNSIKYSAVNSFKVKEESVTAEFSLPDGYTALGSVILNQTFGILKIGECTEGSAEFFYKAEIEGLKVKFDNILYLGILAEGKSGKKIFLLRNNGRLKGENKKRFGHKSDCTELVCSLPEGYVDNAAVTDAPRRDTVVYKRVHFTENEKALAVGIYKLDCATSAKYKKISCKGNTLKFKISIPKYSEFSLKNVYLKYRSKVEDTVFELPFTAKEKKNRFIIKVKYSFEKEDNLKELYWDAFISTENRETGLISERKIHSGSIFLKLKLVATNTQLEIDGSNILYPYVTKRGDIAFSYREKCEYDSSFVRLKEFWAFFLYMLSFPIFKFKKIWVVYEKFSRTAQDNSYYFFKYCMENLSEKEKKNIYYVIDKRQSDYKYVEKYGKRVVNFMSVKHIFLCLAMKVCISSDAKSHLYVWRSKPSIIRHYGMIRKKTLFLQHGVTALKKVDVYFGKKGSNPVSYYVTTSPKEQEIIVENFGYKPEFVPITGFARWDVFENRENKENKFILMMPTWRSWLEEVSSEIFVSSDYYKNYRAFLTSEKLAKLLEENNINMIFYLHPKFAEYIEEFRNNATDRIKYIAFGETPLNELMMQCSMLITDYSSVCWDVLYLGKPIVFYQFDLETYELAHGSYIDMRTELPGERVETEDGLMKAIKENIERGFEPHEKSKKAAAEFFPYKDNDNSKRIYEFLKELGY